MDRSEPRKGSKTSRLHPVPISVVVHLVRSHPLDLHREKEDDPERGNVFFNFNIIFCVMCPMR